MSTIIMIKHNSDVCGSSFAFLFTSWKQEIEQLRDNEEILLFKEKNPVCKGFVWLLVWDFFCRKYLFFKCRYFSFQNTLEKLKLKNILFSSLVGTPTDSYTSVNSLL